jgi:hypothetical protein
VGVGVGVGVDPDGRMVTTVVDGEPRVAPYALESVISKVLLPVPPAIRSIVKVLVEVSPDAQASEMPLPS